VRTAQWMSTMNECTRPNYSPIGLCKAGPDCCPPARAAKDRNGDPPRTRTGPSSAGARERRLRGQLRAIVQARPSGSAHPLPAQACAIERATALLRDTDLPSCTEIAFDTLGRPVHVRRHFRDITRRGPTRPATRAAAAHESPAACPPCILSRRATGQPTIAVRRAPTCWRQYNRNLRKRRSYEQVVEWRSVRARS